WFFVLPGVPRELEKMMDEQVMPRLERLLEVRDRSAAGGGVPRRVVRAALLRTFGMGESTLEAELRDLVRGGDAELGFRTAFPDNFLRPVARATSAAEADRRIADAVRAIRERLGPIVFGEGDD